jgi:carbon-nitrogen hydrolase
MARAKGQPKKKIDDHHKQRELPKEIVHEAKMLFRTISHTTKTLTPLPIPLGKRRPSGGSWPDLRIGLLSRRVSIAKAADDEAELIGFRPSLRLYGTEMSPYYHMSRPHHARTIALARQKLKEDIQYLVEIRGANVVCVNELGYPAFKLPREKGYDKELHAQLRQLDAEFRDFLQELCNQHECVIVCGSYHDVEDFKNKAVIFAPREAGAKERQNEYQKEHQKLTTAKAGSVGEVVRTPPHTGFELYDTYVGRVGVLICSDVVDMNIFFQLTLIGTTRPESSPDVILVPSWTEAPLTRACQDLSYFSNTVVAYVNGNGEPHAAVYMGGELVKEWRDVGRESITITGDARSKRRDECKEAHENGMFAGMVGTMISPR